MIDDATLRRDISILSALDKAGLCHSAFKWRGWIALTILGEEARGCPEPSKLFYARSSSFRLKCRQMQATMLM